MDYSGFLKDSFPLFFPSRMREIAESSPRARQAMAAESASSLVSPLYTGFLKPALPASAKIGSITRTQLGELLRKGSRKALKYIKESLADGTDPLQVQDVVRNEIVAGLYTIPKGTAREAFKEKMKLLEPMINDIFRRYQFQ